MKRNYSFAAAMLLAAPLALHAQDSAQGPRVGPPVRRAHRHWY